jgi:hypothetical protein
MGGRQSNVFSRVEKYYEDYGMRARALKEEGKKLIGYLCSFGNHHRGRVYPFSGERKYT